MKKFAFCLFKDPKDWKITLLHSHLCDSIIFSICLKQLSRFLVLKLMFDIYKDTTYVDIQKWLSQRYYNYFGHIYFDLYLFKNNKYQIIKPRDETNADRKIRTNKKIIKIYYKITYYVNLYKSLFGG